MLRLFRLFFVSFLLPVTIHAQMEITWGVPQKQARKTAMSDIISSDGSYVYTLRRNYALFSSDFPILERYKLSDLSLDYSKVIPMKTVDGHDLDFDGIWYVKGNILVFGSDYDRERDVNILFAEVLDDHGAPVKSWSPVATIPAAKRSNPGSFYLDLARDSAHILLVLNPPYDKYAEEKFTLQLLDKELKTDWKKEIVPPYKDQFFALDNFIVSKNGDVYMMATVSKDKSVMSRTERRTKPMYYHTALLYDRANDTLKEYHVNLDPKFISDVKMEVAENGDMICAGFYSNKSSNAIIGSFYLKIDKNTKAVSSIGTKDFDKDFLVQFMTAKRASKGKELYNYILKHLVLRDDGGAVLVAEQYYEIMVQSYDPQTKLYSYTYYYYYNDIIVISINPNGTIAWAQKIPKYQISHNDGGFYSSFAFAVSGDKMYFMFNDNAKNLKSADSDKYKYMNNPKKSVAILVTMDSKGNQDRQAMFNNKDLKIILRPKLFLQMNEKRMILYGEKGSTFKLADVKIS